MLKKLVKKRELLSQENTKVIENIKKIEESPLSCFGISSVEDFYKEQDEAIKEVKKYSTDELVLFLAGENIYNALYSNDGDVFIEPSKTLTVAGNVIELVEQSNKSKGNGIIKIDKGHYINLRSPIHPMKLKLEGGEQIDGFQYREDGFYYQIFTYNSIGMKSNNELRKTFRRLSYIINSNVTEPDKCLWVTLTYADNIKGADGNKKLYEDFRKGIQILKRKYGKFEYISVVEPQGRGAWHCHVIFIFPKKTYIPNKEISNAWRQGFTSTKGMRKDADNLGAYLTAYLTDIPLEEGKGLYTLEQAEDILNSCAIVEKEGKKFIKGGRLYLYPPYMKIYRTSRGIKQPEVYKDVTDKDLLEKVGDLPILYQTMYELSLEEKTDYKNIIRYTQYNKNVQTEEEVKQRKERLKHNKNKK